MLTVLLGVAALAVDVSILMAARRQAQGAADAAALAAASTLLGDSAPYTATKNTAQNVAKANYADTSHLTVTANIPPTQGTFKNITSNSHGSYVEVIVEWNQTTCFSGVFGFSTIPVSARAVARVRLVPVAPALLLLDPTDPSVLSTTGNGSIVVKNGSIVVDSNSASAITTSGSHGVISDANPGQILVTGNPGYSGSGISPTPTPSQPPTPDPLRTLAAPTQPSAAPAPTTSGGVTTYYPGYYANGLSLTGGYKAVFSPGTYFMNGTVTVNGNPSSSLTGNGVTIYLDPNATLSLGGNGNVTLSPPTSGTYQGLVVYQDRSNANGMQIAGNGKLNVTGTVYAPAATVSISGNGDGIASQLISSKVTNRGGGNSGQINITYNSSLVAQTPAVNLVE
jgi:Flp pilus assembly protein TadG